MHIVYFLQTFTARDIGHPEEDSHGLKIVVSQAVAEDVEKGTDQLTDLNGEETMDVDAAGQREQDNSNQDVSEINLKKNIILRKVRINSPTCTCTCSPFFSILPSFLLSFLLFCSFLLPFFLLLSFLLLFYIPFHPLSLPPSLLSFLLSLPSILPQK